MKTIQITIKNSSHQYDLDLSKLTEIKIGRESTCNVVTPSIYEDVSRVHAILIFDHKFNKIYFNSKGQNGSFILPEETLILQGESFEINNKTEIKLGSSCILHFEIINTTNIEGQKSPVLKGQYNTIAIAIEKKPEEVKIGRDTSNDIVINEPMVSREHAKITKINNKYYIEDLCSSNGTFVNNERIHSITLIDEKSTIHIGPYSLNWFKTEIKSDRAIEAIGVFKKWGNKTGLHPLNFSINKGEFVALMGPSGCGKTTLLKLLSKNIECSGGILKINGEDINNQSNWNRLKHAIGYVDQNDESLIPDLTVIDTMYFTAKLRLPSKTSEFDIQNRIKEILLNLNLPEEHWYKRINQLSGGQRKRVSIGVELMSEPQILFLDEPTSPLDPESINMFLQTIKNLAKERAVLMVTHKPDDLNYVDKVFFMGTGGYHLFYDKKETLLSTFKVKNILEVYENFSRKESCEFYYKRIYESRELSHRSFQQTKLSPNISFMKQFYWSSFRYLKAKLQSGLTTITLISTILPLFAFLALSNFVISVPFMIVILSIFLGLFNGIEEIIYDKKTFNREKKINMRLSSYYFSKFCVLSLFAIVQAFIICLISTLRFSANETSMAGINDFFNYFILSAFLIISSIILGLFVSAISKRLNHAIYSLLLVLIIQILFAGTFTKIDNLGKETISFFSLSRWGMQAFAHIQNNDDNLGTVLTYTPKMVKNLTRNIDTFYTGGRMVIHDSTFLKVSPSKKFNDDTLAEVHPMSLLSFYPPWSKSDSTSKIENKTSVRYSAILPENMRNLTGSYISIFILNTFFIILTLIVLRNKNDE